MKRILKLFAFISLGVLLGYLIHLDPGYILIDYHHTSIETSLWVGLAVIILSFLLTHMLLRFLKVSFTLKKRMRKRRENRKLKKHRLSLEQGLIHIAQGEWKQAQQKFLSGIKYHTDPTANFIGAITSVQAKGETNLDAIKSKCETTESTSLLLSKAQLYLHTKQWQAAESCLQNCLKLHQENRYALKLLCQLYHNTENWSALEKILPTAIKFSALEKTSIQHYRIAFSTHQLSSLANQPREVQLAWEQLPKATRYSTEILSTYCRILCQHQLNSQALSLIEQQLKSQWCRELLYAYAQAAVPNDSDRLTQAEKWLKRHPNDPGLMHCLGLLSLKNRMLTKAEQYFKSAQKIQPAAEHTVQLALLCEQTNRYQEAIQYLKKNLCQRDTV